MIGGVAFGACNYAFHKSDKISSRRQFLYLPQPMNTRDYLHGTIVSTDLVKRTLNKEVVSDVLSTTATVGTTFVLQRARLNFLVTALFCIQHMEW